MRTTVTLDPDTEQLIQRRMSERGTSFKETLNEAVRSALGSAEPPKHETPSFDMGRPTINLDRALELADNLELDELLRKQRVGK